MSTDKSLPPFEHIVLVGAGNVASHLGKALKRRGFTIDQVFSRSLEKAKDLADQIDAQAVNDPEELFPDRDLYVIAVKDEAIGYLIGSLPASGDATVVHTSGSMPLSVLDDLPGPKGVLYPFQTFSSGKTVNWDQVPICIEASDERIAARLMELGRTLSPNTHYVNSQQRKTLHVAGIFSCNFTNHLYSVASDILRENGMSFRILEPLVRETLEKALEHGPENAQTGPAARNDQKIVHSHLEYLKDQPERQRIYDLLSQSIITRYHGEEL